MTRHAITYGERRVPARTFEGFDPDLPRAGFYRMRLRSGGVFVGIRIWHGLPLDPDTGDALDRAPRWNATANGKPIDLDRVWPACADAPVSGAEHDHLASLQAWGAEHGHAALADPRRPLSPLSSPLLF